MITKRLAELVGEIDIVSEVFIANDYYTALQSIDAYNPELVLLDIHLGEKNGVDLLIHIKKEYPFIKVMMVSNKASQYYRDLCKEHGCDYFIDKSKEFDQIALVIKSFYSDL